MYTKQVVTVSGFSLFSSGFVYEFGSGALYFTDKRSSISPKQTDLQNKSPFRTTLKMMFIKSILFITRYLPLYFNQFSNYVLTNLVYCSLHFIVFITNVVLFTNSEVDITNVVNGYITCHYYLFVIMLILVSMNKLGLVYKMGILQVHIFVGLFITLIKYGICSNTIHFLLTSYNSDYSIIDITSTTSATTLGSTIAYNSSNSIIEKGCIPWHVNDKVLKAQDVLLEMFKYISKEPNQAVFAKEYLEPLVNPLTGNTNLPIDFISKEAIMSCNKTFIISNEGEAVRTGNQFTNMMGIYSFTSNDYNIDNTYIGLTQNFSNRIKLRCIIY